MYKRHHLLRWPRPNLLRVQLFEQFELLLLWRPRQPLSVQHQHRHYAVPVHRVRRQGPALLHRLHDHRGRVQIALRVHVQLLYLWLLVHVYGSHGDVDVDVDGLGLVAHFAGCPLACCITGGAAATTGTGAAGRGATTGAG